MAGRTLVLLAVLALVVVCSARSLQTNDKRKAPKDPMPSLPKEPKPVNIKPTNTKPTKPAKVVKEPSKDEKVPMTAGKKNVTYESLTEPQKMCVDKYMGWYNVEILKPYEQCGGKGAECASYGSEELHCLDAPFYDHQCPKGFTCERQDPSDGMYYQCVENKEKGDKEDKEKGDKKDEDKEEEMMMVEERMTAASSRGKNIPIDIKEEGWEKLNNTKKELIGANCLGWPVKGAKKMLKPYGMCGGTAPQACSKYGPCKDEPFPEYECPEDYECKKLNVYWWMCQPIA